MKKKKVKIRKRRINKEKFSFVPIVLVLAAILILGSVFIKIYQKPIIVEMPAPPPGAIEIDSCMTLDQAGSYYYLNASLTNINGSCFSIIAEDITLDGQGHPIIGVYNGNGVQSTAANSEIINFYIRHFDIGIFLAGGSLNSSLVNNNVSDNVKTDVYDIYSINVQIKTIQDDYLPGERVELTDASELG